MVSKKTCTSQGIFLTAFYNQELFLTIKQNGFKKNYRYDFFPYLFLLASSQLSQEDINFLSSSLKNLLSITRVEKENHAFCYKLTFKDIASFLSSREHLFKDVNLSVSFELREYDIPFIQRFFVDHSLCCFKKISFTFEDDKVLSFEILEDMDPDSFSHFTFDIEVLPQKDLSFPVPKSSPVISIAFMHNNSYEVFFLKDFSFSHHSLENQFKSKDVKLTFFTQESEMIESFFKAIEDRDPDLIFTYNGDFFDFSYLYKRYKHLKSSEPIFNKRILFSRTRSRSVSIDSIIHVDTYLIIKLLNYLQLFNFSKLNLDIVYPALTGSLKKSLTVKELYDSYISMDYQRIIEYNMDDVHATYTLSKNYFSIINEISKLIHTPIFDTLRISAGQMIERLFIYHSFKNNLLINNRPTSDVISARYAYTFTGAFVKDPLVGLHKNIAVVDFRSYHISILMAYNISFETIDIDSSDYTEILGHKISKQKKGFVPSILKNFLNLRLSIKQTMNTYPKHSQEYKNLYAKQFALKILLASTYGYMGFSGARWYCRPCLDIMYHLVRTNIQKTIEAFESFGYEVIYGDTDSCFIKYTNKQKLLEHIDSINKSLPDAMSLEIEDFFKAGLFVFSRDGKKGAKKKYALLSENNSLKIKGFEFVRRDWCVLVKETQKRVLKIILEEGDVLRALAYTREVIKNLETKSLPLEKFILSSFVRKNLKNYKSTNPARQALLFAKKNNQKIKEREVVEYIITSIPSKSISEKARLYEQGVGLDYDVDYYIHHQLLPALFSIFEVFDISKEEILTGKKQKSLNDFF